MPDPRKLILVMRTMARRQLTFAFLLFAGFIAIVIGSGIEWSWSVFAIVVAIGVALVLLAVIVLFLARDAARGGGRER